MECSVLYFWSCKADEQKKDSLMIIVTGKAFVN